MGEAVKKDLTEKTLAYRKRETHPKTKHQTQRQGDVQHGPSEPYLPADQQPQLSIYQLGAC